MVQSTGKSTLTTFWEYLSRQAPDLPSIQTLPMDGFHHYNAWLDANHLRTYKGAPETFTLINLPQIWLSFASQSHTGRSMTDKNTILSKRLLR